MWYFLNFHKTLAGTFVCSSMRKYVNTIWLVHNGEYISKSKVPTNFYNSYVKKTSGEYT